MFVTTDLTVGHTRRDRDRLCICRARVHSVCSAAAAGCRSRLNCENWRDRNTPTEVEICGGGGFAPAQRIIQLLCRNYSVKSVETLSGVAAVSPAFCQSLLCPDTSFLPRPHTGYRTLAHPVGIEPFHFIFIVR